MQIYTTAESSNHLYNAFASVFGRCEVRSRVLKSGKNVEAIAVRQ
jgi:hypothetical protein